MKKIFKILVSLGVIIIIGGSFFYFYYIWAPQHYDFNCEENNCILAYTGFSACTPCNCAHPSVRCVPVNRLKMFRRIKRLFHIQAMTSTELAKCECPPTNSYLRRCDPRKTNVSDKQCVKAALELKEKLGPVLSSYYFLGSKISKDFYSVDDGKLSVLIDHSCSPDKLDDIKGIEIGSTAGNISTARVLPGKHNKLLDVAALDCVEYVEIEQKMEIPSPPPLPKEPTK